MCGEKQSFKKNYGKGTGKECRDHVMKLNKLRLSKDISACENKFIEPLDESIEDFSFCTNDLNQLNNEEDWIQFCVTENESIQTSKSAAQKPVSSKWLQYLDEDDIKLHQVVDRSNDNESLPKKRKIREQEFSSFNEEECTKILDIKDSTFKPTHEKNMKVETLLTDISDTVIVDSFVNSKFNKFLDKDNENESEVKKGLSKAIKKSSNIFSSDSKDFDDIINISF